MSNLFDLPEPGTLLCHLLRYDRSGSHLDILVYPEVGQEPVCTLQFKGVVYVDAPVFWRSADFHRATDTDCLALLRQLHVHNDLPGDNLVGQFHLYRAMMLPSQQPVRVLAIDSQRIDFT